MPKGTCWAEAMSNSEKKNKPVALAVIELRLSEGISQSITQSVSYSVSQLLSQSVTRKVLFDNFFKFRSNLLKAFRVGLKACLGLVLPNQYCLIVRENEK